MYYTPPNVIMFTCSILVVFMYFIFRVENSVDPDQIASSEASWSGSTLCQALYLGYAGQGLMQ